MGEIWTRRGILTLVAGAGATRLFAFGSDPWEKKDPTDWTHEDIEKLTSKSPWAKEVSASAPATGGGGMGQGGGMGGGGMGGGGMGRRGGMGRPGAGGQSYKGTVLWESAKPIVLAKKTEIPKAFDNHYVISVSGIPLGGGRRRQQSQDDDSSQSSQDMLDRLKQVTFLEPKGRRDAQPGVVQQPVSGSYGSVWFGFDRDFLNLKAEDKEASFTTQFGQLTIKAKFNLKDMMFKGELAI
jgi:hypothetical protein